MEMCRACGELPDGQLSESLQKYSDIYYNLTSIKLTPEEDPNHQLICNECHLKLLEYNRFRTVCLQVHYKLAEIKTEIHLDQQDFVAPECSLVEEAFKIEESYIAPESDSTPPPIKVKENDDSDHDAFSAGGDSDSDYEKPLKRRKSEESNEDSGSEYEKPVAPKKKSKSKKKPAAEKKKKKEPAPKKTPLPVFACHLCDKKCHTEQRFQGHLRVHQGLKPAVCTHCGKDFADYKNLRIHLLRKHSDTEVKYPCDIDNCDKVYSTKQGLQLHKKTHNPDFVAPIPTPAICDHCGKTFSTKGALKTHSYTHSGELPFQCKICNKRLLTAFKLKEHIMRHEGIKRFECHVCGLKKTTRCELKVHMNYHTLEKQYTCHVCAQVFNSVASMTRHIKVVHQGIKAFSCTYCDQSFGKAETLKHHIMTHTGEKPHECKVCGKRFIQMVALKKHSNTHLKEHPIASQLKLQ